MRRLTLFLLTTVILISLGATAVMTQQVHVVQRGENLYQISRKYDRTVEELAQANGISPPYIIHAGNEITIPAPGGLPQAPTQELETATVGEENYCYIIGDVCVIISNVGYLDGIDCGDGTDWFSQRAWKRGWCMAAIYAGVVNGMVWQCTNGSALTVAEKALISSLNGMPVIWQHQLYQYQQSSANGNQQSNTGGNNQQGTGQTGGNQQGTGRTGGNQQGTGQTGGNQQQELIVLQSENPPPDQLPQIPQDQQDQQQLLLQILNQQQEPQYQQAQGPKGEQQPDKQGGHPSDSYPDCENDPLIKSVKRGGQYVRSYKEVPCIERNPPDNRVEDEGSHTVSGPDRPNYKPLVPESGQCRAEVNCYNCSWQMEAIYGTKGKTKNVRVCKVKGEDPCTAYDEYTVNISETPATITWKYVCT